MGYACPVCDAPQADDEHLANHLAFSALLRHDDHEDWLDEHAPDWGDADPETLAETVVEYVEEVEYPDVFEDTTAQHDHAHDQEHAHDLAPGQPLSEHGNDDDLTPDAREILEEARELTAKRRQNAGDDADDSQGDADANSTDDGNGSDRGDK